MIKRIAPNREVPEGFIATTRDRVINNSESVFVSQICRKDRAPSPQISANGAQEFDLTLGLSPFAAAAIL